MSEPLPHPGTGDLFASPVPPGSGWPGDTADPDSPVATTAEDVAEIAPALLSAGSVRDLDAALSVCRACPRLVAWREDVAVTKRASFAGEPYWGGPVPGFGSERPRVLVVGLAPAANGANRTGRVFTGDRSGDWLYAGLHRAGLASQPTAVHAADGLALAGTRVLAAVRCAPPANKPTPAERDACAPWLDAELRLVGDDVRAVVALGGFGWTAALRALAGLGHPVPRPAPKFGHGAEVVLPAVPGSPSSREVTVLGCYHPSQQNTFTGRLTESMLDDVLGRAAALATIAR